MCEFIDLAMIKRITESRVRDLPLKTTKSIHTPHGRHQEIFQSGERFSVKNVSSFFTQKRHFCKFSSFKAKLRVLDTADVKNSLFVAR